jgi:phosphatidylglycerophosphate synthase
MDHIREHRSVLAGAERRLLIAIAQRLPSWVTSDQLTALALVSMLGAGAAAGAIGRLDWSAWPFALALGANWFGDSLDGTLARVRRHERPRYGYYVDHVIDIAGTAALLIGLGASGLMSPLAALPVLVAYLMVAAEAYLATVSVGTFRVSFAGMGPTELRIALAIGVAFAAARPSVEFFGRPVLMLDVGGVAAAAGLCLVFVASAVRNSIALYKAEPLSPPTARRRVESVGGGREVLL